MAKSSYDNELIQTVLQYHQHSKTYKSERQRRNNFNWNIYQGKQDYSHKRKGQSKEFVPKLALGVEYLVATVLNGLTNRSDDWFSIQKGLQPDDVFDPDTIRTIMSYELYNADAYVFLSNAIKNVGLDSFVSAKVYGCIENIPRFHVEPGTPFVQVEGQPPQKAKKTKVEKTEVKRWKLAIDLIDFESYDEDPEPNPSGPLYKIHTVKRDLHELIEVAENYPDIYDMKVIKSIQESFEDQEAEENKRQRKGQTKATQADFRKKITMREMWGTVLDRQTGKIKEKNIVMTIANDKYLIRPPQKNTRMDGKDPFVSSSLINIPGSIHGKGFLDAAASMNKTYNEGYNLLLDGFFDQIKGIKQFRRGIMTNPRQASGSIPTGATVEIDESTPPGVQVIEKCRTGEVPQDAFGFLKYTEDNLNESMFSNENRLGGYPSSSSTKATAISIADQSLSGIMGGLARIFEDKFVAPLLEKSWAEILQNMTPETFAEEEIVNLLGKEKALQLSKMTVDERYARGALAGKFSVRGISAIMSRAREFQKLVSILDIVSKSPELYAEFKNKFSMGRTLSAILSAANMREDELKLTEEEKKLAKVKGSIQQIMESALQQAGSQNGAKPQEGNLPLMEGNA